MISPRKALRKISVLVVDDDPDIGENLKDILEELDYEVCATIDPAQAIDWTKERGFDLTILDLKMPHMNGLQLLDELRRVRHDTTAVIATAFAESETVRQALGQGVLDVLRKPVDMETLLKTVRDVTASEPV